MNTNQEVEIILACAYGDVGQKLRPNGVLRNWLVDNGFAKIIEVENRPAKFAGKAAKKLGDLLSR